MSNHHNCKLTNYELIDAAINWGLHWTGIDDSEAIDHFTLARRHAALSDAGISDYNKRILAYSRQLQEAAAELPLAKQRLAMKHCLHFLRLAGVESEVQHG
jgi:hypothetical protein